VVVEHLERADVAVFEGDELELDAFPEFDDGVDLFVHLGFVFGDFADLLDCVFVVEETKIPQKFEFEVVVD
jgi:hypothetical protein